MDPKWPENQIRPHHLAASELQVLRWRSEQDAGVEGLLVARAANAAMPANADL